GATTNSYTAYSAGTYKLTISASGCSSKSDEATVTSSLPVVVGDTICSAGKVTLSVTSSGDYDWYSVAEEGSALASGSTYSPNITKTTTYYVQDASSLNTTAGPTFNNLQGSQNYSNQNYVQVTAKSAVTITEISAVIGNVYYASSQQLTVTVNNKEYKSKSVQLSNAGNYTFSFESNPIVLSAGSYKISVKPDNAGFTSYRNCNYSSFPHSDILEFSKGSEGDYAYPGVFNWKIVAGSTCARTPVFAVLDPDNPNCAGDTEAPSVPGTITVSNITTNSASVSWGASTDNTAVTGYDVYVNGTKLQSVTTNSINLSDLNDNTEYTIKVRAYDEAGNLSEFNTEKSFTTLKSTVTQSISLSAGWNLISFYVLPEDASITNVFGSNISKVSIVKNNDGFYKPSKADKLQSLTEFEYGQAYLVKANSAFSISVEGVAPTSTTISLKAGWNLLGYPKTTEANASNVLSGIAGKYTELKDLSSSQTTLKPGKGYYIKMNSDASVTIGN
ncbi:MAG: fibronectin type III domain-containing protein, partial [Bacteroidales bacterium]|nr:fibronectin type III domain-containing protein [Bacteroidales bacterium]